uniref:Uncharacterized protein n=1 Tax=Brassica oleracea TaxID=3712 RepID=A0A3P6DIE8_BRAOL|nr:unnamed protein product [Brassica oleracea]
MEDESRRWFSSLILLIGGSCRRFFSSVALLADARWLPSTNFGGYRRRIKSIVRKTFVVSEGIKKEPKQVPGDILSFFTRKNFNGTDRGETITFEGTMVSRRGQAALLTFCTCTSSSAHVPRYMPNHLPYIKRIAPYVPYHKHLLSDLLFHLNTFLPLVLLFLSSFTHSDMDYPYTSGSNFVDLLQSQQSVFGSSEVSIFGTQQTLDAESPVERIERRKWTPSDDILLISSWLNTSKDPVVGNEQR